MFLLKHLLVSINPEDGGPGGATTDAVSIMSANAGPLKVKASGGIYSREDLE